MHKYSNVSIDFNRLQSDSSSSTIKTSFELVFKDFLKTLINRQAIRT